MPVWQLSNKRDSREQLIDKLASRPKFVLKYHGS